MSHSDDNSPSHEIPTVAPRPPATYLHPDRPFSNDLAIRRIVRDLRGVVFWYEQHMSGRALELLLDELQLAEVDEVRLLSGPANVTRKVKRSFERFAPSSPPGTSEPTGACSGPIARVPCTHASLPTITKPTSFRH
jgi:hypothetical protein